MAKYSTLQKGKMAKYSTLQKCKMAKSSTLQKGKMAKYSTLQKAKLAQRQNKCNGEISVMYEIPRNFAKKKISLNP